MNWEQFKTADDFNCVINTVETLEQAMTSTTEAIESLDESIQSLNDSGFNTVLIESLKSIKTNLSKEQDYIENAIEHLRDYLDS